MRAATFSQTGPPSVLHVGEIATPEPGPGEVRVKIATSGVNPSDVKRRGAAPHGKPAEFPVVIPHSDGAGTIDAVGAGVAQARIGERVWLWNAQYGRAFGTAAEYCVLPDIQAFTLPYGVDFAVGACLGIPALTAAHAVILDGDISGQTLLVQGGAGAVGFYAIQFAKAAGARVIATVSSDAKAKKARDAGADEIVNYKTEDRKARIAALTGGKGVDRIIEVDLAANAVSYPDVLRKGGKAVVYGSGKSPIELPSMIPYSTTIQFMLVYRLTTDQRIAATACVMSMLGDDTLKHDIGPRFVLDDIVKAHETVEAGADGNVILDVA